MEAWQSFWKVIFFVASALFYLIVIAVASRGLGDIGEMFAELRRKHGE